MLKDPLTLPASTAVDEIDIEYTDTVVCPLIDAAEPGRTVRNVTIAGLSGRLTLSRSETKESKPYGTKRVNCRAEVIDLDSEGRPVVTFVQVTFGLPKANSDITTLNAVKRVLLTTVLLGQSLEGPNCSTAAGDSLVSRLMSGEL
jgi:hypothetical protein